MKSVSKSLSIMMLFAFLLVAAACTPNQEGGPEGGPEDAEGDAGGEEGGGEEAELEEGQMELRVAWWGSQTRHDRTLEVIDLFEEEYPDIAVSTEYTGWDGYWERLATQAASENLPDVIQMDLQYLAEYQSRDLIENLDPFIEEGTLDFEDVDDIYLEGGEVEDELYAVNLGANSLTIVYDPAMFEEAGVPEFEPGYTWEDYIDAAHQIRNHFGEEVYMATPKDLHGFKHYLRQRDMWLYNEDNNGLGYDDDQLFIDYYNMWDDLLKEGIAPGPQITTEIEGLEDELIVHEKSPVLMPHSNQIVGLQSAADRPLELALLPSEPGGTDGHFVKPSMFFSASSQSNAEEQEAAALFIDFFTNNKEANEILAAERGVPISKEVQDHLYPQLEEYEQKQFDYMEVVEENSSPIHPPEPSGVGEIQGIFERGLEEVEYGEITVEEFAEQFREEAEQVLAD
ncbi:ABC transporter substrate-binding protein [Alteribacillus sp. HJP-4]|uniref:ABC transporter substrate-binding protein n=1 Tax=Alteribacillus sp. HJP-4 TaxID=2775394 RepID=UPI0035CCD0F3